MSAALAGKSLIAEIRLAHPSDVSVLRLRMVRSRIYLEVLQRGEHEPLITAQLSPVRASRLQSALARSLHLVKTAQR